MPLQCCLPRLFAKKSHKDLQNDYTQYPIHGVCKFEDYPNFFRVPHGLQNRDPEMLIGSAGGHPHWYIKLQRSDYGEAEVHTTIGIRYESRNVIFIARIIQSIYKNGVVLRPIKSRLISHCSSNVWGFTAEKEILHKKNGWLDENGTLSVAYGIYVVKVKKFDRWTFNFYDPVFGHKNMITFTNGKKKETRFYAHKQMTSDADEKYIFVMKVPSTITVGNTYEPKPETITKVQCRRLQLLTHNCPNYSNEDPSQNLIVQTSKNINMDQLEKCLQIAHGVQIKLHNTEITDIALIAQILKFPNVMRDCEWRYMKTKEDPMEYNFQVINSFGWNRYLAFLLRKMESTKKLKKILDDVEIQQMSGESMKHCVKFFFDN